MCRDTAARISRFLPLGKGHVAGAVGGQILQLFPETLQCPGTQLMARNLTLAKLPPYNSPPKCYARREAACLFQALEREMGGRSFRCSRAVSLAIIGSRSSCPPSRSLQNTPSGSGSEVPPGAHGVPTHAKIPPAASPGLISGGQYVYTLRLDLKLFTQWQFSWRKRTGSSEFCWRTAPKRSVVPSRKRLH